MDLGLQLHGAASVEVGFAGRNGKHRRRDWFGRRDGANCHVQPRGKFPLAFENLPCRETTTAKRRGLSAVQNGSFMTLMVHGSVRQLTFSLRHNVPTWSYHEVGTTLTMSARGLICSYEVES
jgi:hypothetical protein